MKNRNLMNQKQARQILLYFSLSLCAINIAFAQTPNSTQTTDPQSGQAAEIKAKKLFVEAATLLKEAAPPLDEKKEKLLQAALNKFQEASGLFKESKNDYAAAGSILGAARASYSLNNKESTLKFYKQAVTIFQEISAKSASPNRLVEAELLSNMGQIYLELEKKSESLEHLNQALSIYEAAAQPAGVAVVLYLKGSVHLTFADNATAIDYFEKALALFIKNNNIKGESDTRNEIGTAYYNLGKYEKSLEYFNQSLALRKDPKANDKCREAATLTGMSLVYSSMEEKAKAVSILINQALPIYETAPHCPEQAATLTNLGKIYFDLGEEQKALEYYRKSQPLYRDSDKRGIAANSHNIGNVYLKTREKELALEYYEKALSIYREIGDQKYEASTLTNIGLVHLNAGQTETALGLFYKALDIRNKIDDKGGQAVSLNNIGWSYAKSGENRKALDFYNRSLPLFRITGNIHGEAIALGNAMISWELLGKRETAIFYGKNSVNKFQELRGKARGVENEIQKSFLHGVKDSYRYLTESLIKKGQLEQAIQVLNLYQDEQFFDFNLDVDSPVKQIILSAQELELFNRYEIAMAKLEKLYAQIEEFKLQNPGKPESAQLQQLEAQLKTANDAFSSDLTDVEKNFTRRTVEKNKAPHVTDVAEMQASLRELNTATKQKTATLYTLIGNDRFHAILITVDQIKHFESRIKSEYLNKQILQFYALLQSPAYEPRRLGRQLYNIIFKPLEAELKKSGARTLMWQLDGNLRYVPMAALFDGEKYLVERYQNVSFTRANRERMIRDVSRNWTGTAFGSSKAQTVDLLGDGNKTSFSALPGVTQELESIFRTDTKSSGILNGVVLSDDNFTKTAFYDALKRHRPLVHISSHFSFHPGDDLRSFLLLGDGFLTLNELKKQRNLFRGVELLTLSACNTAATRSDANGREIDGFSELAQRLGTGAVMATLWQVSDASTPWIMRDFYANRQSKKDGMTKIESLQKAQLALLYNTAQIKPLMETAKGASTSPVKLIVIPKGVKRSDNNQTRSDVIYLNENEAPLFQKDGKKPFAHPYYWSSFVLIGNWR